MIIYSVTFNSIYLYKRGSLIDTLRDHPMIYINMFLQALVIFENFNQAPNFSFFKLFFFTIQLLVFHIYLLNTNQTTREVVQYRQERNPFQINQNEDCVEYCVQKLWGKSSLEKINFFERVFLIKILEQQVVHHNSNEESMIRDQSDKTVSVSRLGDEQQMEEISRDLQLEEGQHQDYQEEKQDFNQDGNHFTVDKDYYEIEKNMQQRLELKQRNEKLAQSVVNTINSNMSQYDLEGSKINNSQYSNEKSLSILNEMIPGREPITQQTIYNSNSTPYSGDFLSPQLQIVNISAKQHKKQNIKSDSMEFSPEKQHYFQNIKQNDDVSTSLQINEESTLANEFASFRKNLQIDNQQKSNLNTDILVDRSLDLNDTSAQNISGF